MPGANTTFLTLVLAVAVLYFARIVLIPLALSVLLTFLLAPLVVRVRRLGLGRIWAAIVVMVVAFLLSVIMAFAMAVQLGDLAQRMPEYESNVRKKVHSIRDSALVKRVTAAVHDINHELTPSREPSPSLPPSEKPVPVEIRGETISVWGAMQAVVGSAIEITLMGAIVVVFVIFMLLQKEDLRDRVIRLAGERRINVTTQVLDDAARRVSRYLLAQLGLNATFGALAGIGLYIIGVPNPLLWAMITAILRYVPYLGIWVSALLPAAVAFAVEPGWVKVPTIFIMYFGIDILFYNFAEPILYGNSTGVSPIGILVAAVVWTWLWGPVGLLLATPLTVCVVVLGRYVPHLRFVSVMLSDEEALTPQTRLYHRLLAMDLAEATEAAEEYLKEHTAEELFDQVVVPALKMAEEDRHRGSLDESRQKTMHQNTRLLVEDISERAEEYETKGKETPASSIPKSEERLTLEGAVLCVPARDEADSIAAQMLTYLLDRRGLHATSLPTGLAGEALDAVEKHSARVVCVVAVPPLSYVHARYMCRRLRKRFPDLKIIGVVLTGQTVEELKQRQPPIIADDLAPSLKQASAEVVSFLPTTQPQLREVAAA